MTLLDTVFYIFYIGYAWVVLPIGFFASLYYLYLQRPTWPLVLAGLAGAGIVPTICGLWLTGHLLALGNLKAACVGAEIGIAYGSCFKESIQRRVGALLGWLIAVFLLCYGLYSNDFFFRQPIDLYIKFGEPQFAINIFCMDAVFLGIIGALADSWIGSRYAMKMNRNAEARKE